METKAKKFDCVSVKRQSQSRLMADYNARKAEFPNYLDFLRSVAENSEWVSSQRRRLQTV